MTATKTAQLELPKAGEWTIDPSHSTVSFVARHLMVSKVRGGFNAFRGTVRIDEVPSNSSVDVEIDAASIDTRDERRDGHLRSPDFLDVERFPVLTFRSTAVRRTGDRTLEVDGDLTIREVTQPVTLDVEFDGTAGDPWGGTRAAFSATTEIDREIFGMTWNQALEAGGVLVGRKVRIDLEVQLAKAA